MTVFVGGKKNNVLSGDAPRPGIHRLRTGSEEE
jgi:hypothetical protein